MDLPANVLKDVRGLLILVGACCALLFPATATAAEVTGPVFDGKGNLVQTPFIPKPEPARLTEARALRTFLEHPKVRDWLARYPKTGRTTQAEFEEEQRSWRVKVWWRDAGQIADGRVDDRTGLVSEAWTGPQVAWKMARGYEGAFGRKEINKPALWLALCALFLVGLGDVRRPLSLRNLDLLALLSFSVSLWFFNKGDIFVSVPLAYPPLIYVIARMTWIGGTGRTPASRPVWPVWLLLAAAVFLLGFRIGLNVQTSNVIDVGYAGVIGADRIVHGEAPYGHMPVQDERKPCGPADADGEIRERVQTNGRCESSNERGDTYGPVSYIGYVPGVLLLGWSGKWDDLPAAHFTAVAFDIVCLLVLALIGWRFGGQRLAATLAFAWTSYPFTQYVSSSNTNDAILPAFLLLGFFSAASPIGRGAFGALAAWTKFAALIVAPLWSTYPQPQRRVVLAFTAAFAGATLASFSILLLEPRVWDAVRTFWDRTLGWQLGRESPFSIWDWGQYHARGIPDLHVPHQIVKVLVVAGALVAAFLPRRKSPLQLAALTAALIAAFELVLTHWFYLYLPWFFPFAAFALLARDRADP
ncbi:MAG TPA: hypothetical protein VGQ84_14085 [Gaiellaceae bacterium]|nr:hypothetical protein [Gaiellaceae bacterium]